MKITRLSPDRVKVFLSENDLLDMDIDAQTLSPQNPKLGVLLYDILAAVKRETGFSIQDGQVIAEANAACGGIELLLSHPKTPGLLSGRASVTFEMADSSSLLYAIAGIPPSFLAQMRLYRYGNKFFLSVPRRKIPPVIYEFSFKNYNSPLAESFLSEHASLLADGYRLLAIHFGIKKIN